MDPLNALANLILGFNKEKNIQKWAKLIFEISYSCIGSFLGITGTSLGTLAKTTSYSVGVIILISVGAGMSTSSVILFSLLRRSPLTKGMLFMAPAEEAVQELNTNLQTIDRTNVK